MADGEFDNLTVNNVLTIGADTELYRSGEDVLKTPDSVEMKRLKVVSSPTDPIVEFHTTALKMYMGYSIASDYLFINNSIDTTLGILDTTGQLRLPVQGSSGGIVLGEDTNLYRSAANVLKTDDSLNVVFDINVDGHILIGASPSIYIRNDAGKIYFGTTDDVNLYRSAANVLKTEGSLIVDGNLGVGVTAGRKLDVNGFSRFRDVLFFGADESWGKITWESGKLQIKAGSGKALTLGSDDVADRAILNTAGQLQLPVSGSSGGIVLGGYVNLYRVDGYVTLATDVDFTVGGGNLNIHAESPGSRISRITFTTYDDEEDQRSTYLEATCVGLMDQTKPVLKTQYGLFVGGDISGYGFLGSATDPNSPTGTGGGAILLGHAFTATSDMPCISLTDLNYQTLWIKKDDGEHTQLTQLPWGDMELGNLTAHGNVLPSSSNVYHVGTNTQYWNGVWANYLKYHTECSSFDAIDDLETLKKIRTINDEEGRQIHDPETLTHLKDADGFYSQERMDGWHISIQKRLLARIETLEKEVKKLTGLLGEKQVD